MTMLDLAKSKMTAMEGIDGQRSYELILDTSAQVPEKKKFRRVVGGAGWPGRGKPGYLVAAGECSDWDFEFETRHFYRIFETGEWMGRPLMSWDAIFDAMSFLTSKFGITPWFCLPCPAPEALVSYSRRITAEKGRPPRFRHLHDPTFESCLSTIYQRISQVKTLHFGSSEAAARLSSLGRDLSREHFDEHPEITALAMAVNGLEYTRAQQPAGKKRAHIVDRIGGY